MARPKTVVRLDLSDVAAMLAEARCTVSYDPLTGLFHWTRYRSARATAGDVAGTVHRQGYRYIRVGGHIHRGNRLAWLLMTGAWPCGQVDHINGDPRDDRWANLREATRAENCANARLRRDNTSGLKGVRKMRDRWQVRIGNGGSHHVGTYDTLEEARAAYAAAARADYGDFARAE